jgi:class 3 adenylate cyclase
VSDTVSPQSATDRMLATVLFTDIVSSTETDVRVGDHRWRELLDQHDNVAKRRIARHRGRLVKTTGDGLLATFDGPARVKDLVIGSGIAFADRGLHTLKGVPDDWQLYAVSG